MSKLRAVLTVMLLLSILTLQCFAADVVDKVVAVVNGEIITLFDYNAKLTEVFSMLGERAPKQGDPSYQELRKSILESMIDDILIRQEASQLKATVSDNDVEQRIREIKQQNKMSDEQFQQQLRLEGMSKQQLMTKMRREMTKQRLIGYMVQRKIIISDDELKEYFERNKSALSQSVGTRLGLIIVSKMDEAKALKKRISANEISFSDAARKYSIGPGAQEGGDIGPVRVEDLASPIQAGLKGLAPGAVSDPITLEGKILLVTLSQSQAQQGGELTFEQAKNEIYERMFREKMEKQFQDYMNKLRAKSLVDVKL